MFALRKYVIEGEVVLSMRGVMDSGATCSTHLSCDTVPKRPYGLGYRRMIRVFGTNRFCYGELLFVREILYSDELASIRNSMMSVRGLLHNIPYKFSYEYVFDLDGKVSGIFRCFENFMHEFGHVMGNETEAFKWNVNDGRKQCINLSRNLDCDRRLLCGSEAYIKKSISGLAVLFKTLQHDLASLINDLIILNCVESRLLSKSELYTTLPGDRNVFSSFLGDLNCDVKSESALKKDLNKYWKDFKSHSTALSEPSVSCFECCFVSPS